MYHLRSLGPGQQERMVARSSDLNRSKGGESVQNFRF